MRDPKEFDAIRPYNDDEVPGVVDELLSDRLFDRQLKIVIPWMPRWLSHAIIRLSFVGIHSTLDFQKRFMVPMVKYVLHKGTKGLTFGYENIQKGSKRYTFVSNHRDIVLDSALLDYMLYKNGFETTCEIAIGDNLLIYPWIKKLVKLNKAFTVRRGLSPRELLQSSQLMSEYMHYAINQKHENIWIAQREGRAKDSNDRTQESVLKMLALGGEGTPVEQIRDMHIVPLTISYEYDPCDYLKAQEFQLKRDDPTYKKSQQDDMRNMQAGIWGFKGRVHYQASPCVDTWIDELVDLPKTEIFSAVAKRMDAEIHRGYRLFPSNYVALDELQGTQEYTQYYTPQEKQTFDAYLDGQLAKVTIPNPDTEFLRSRILTMYSNPLKNQMKACNE